MSDVRDNLTITLSLEDRKLLVYLLSNAIDHQPCERNVFNAMVQLRAHINGTLAAEETMNASDTR